MEELIAALQSTAQTEYSRRQILNALRQGRANCSIPRNFPRYLRRRVMVTAPWMRLMNVKVTFLWMYQRSDRTSLPRQSWLGLLSQNVRLSSPFRLRRSLYKSVFRHQSPPNREIQVNVRSYQLSTSVSTMDLTKSNIQIQQFVQKHWPSPIIKVCVVTCYLNSSNTVDLNDFSVQSNKII